MSTLLLVAFALAVLVALAWVLLAPLQTRIRRGSCLLWLVIGFFPMITALVRGRSAYGQAADDWAEPLVVLLTPIQIFGAILATIICLLSLPSLRDSHRVLLVAAGLYCLVQAVSDLQNATLGATVGPAVSIIAFMAVVLAREDLVTIKTRATRILRVYTWGSLATYLLAPAWSVVPYVHSGRSYFGLDTRLIGLTSGPNYLALLAALAFTLEIFPQHRRPGWLPSAACALVVCLWSQSRSAMLVLVVVVVIAVIVRVRASHWLVLAGIFIASTGCLTLLFPSAQQRVASVLSPDGVRDITTGRTDVWSLAWDEFLSSPLLGRGSTVFSDVYWDDDAARGGAAFANAHNQVLQALAQGGVLGLAATAFLLACLAYYGVRAGRTTQGLSTALVGAIFIQLMFGTPLRSSGFSVNLMLLALCAGVLSSGGSAARETLRTSLGPEAAAKTRKPSGVTTGVS